MTREQMRQKIRDKETKACYKSGEITGYNLYIMPFDNKPAFEIDVADLDEALDAFLNIPFKTSEVTLGAYVAEGHDDGFDAQGDYLMQCLYKHEDGEVL